MRFLPGGEGTIKLAVEQPFIQGKVKFAVVMAFLLQATEIIVL